MGRVADASFDCLCAKYGSSPHGVCVSSYELNSD